MTEKIATNSIIKVKRRSCTKNFFLNKGILNQGMTYSSKTQTSLGIVYIKLLYSKTQDFVRKLNVIVNLPNFKIKYNLQNFH